MKKHASYNHIVLFFRGIEKKIDEYSHAQLMHLATSLDLIGLPQEDILHSIMGRIEGSSAKFVNSHAILLNSVLGLGLANANIYKELVAQTESANRCSLSELVKTMNPSDQLRMANQMIANSIEHEKAVSIDLDLMFTV